MAGSTHPTSSGPLSRRRFLGASAGAAAISLIPAVAQAEPDGRHTEPTVLPSHRGIILYTVRDVVSRAPDPTTGLGGGFRYVFEQLSSMGYKQVELAGYTQSTSILGRQITPAEIRQLLDDNGLIANGSHSSLNFNDPASFQ